MKKQMRKKFAPSSVPRKHGIRFKKGKEPTAKAVMKVGAKAAGRNANVGPNVSKKAPTSFADIREVIKKGRVDEVVKFIDETLRERIHVLINRHNRSLYDALETIYDLKWAFDRLDPDDREEVLSKLSIKVPGDRYYHAFLQAFWPAPTDDVKARKRALNGTSRYARVMKAAEDQGVKPGRLAGLLEKRGGLDGYLGIRRQVKVTKRLRTPDVPYPKKRTTRVGGKVTSPESGRRVRIRVPRPLRHKLTLQIGKLIALIDADPTSGKVMIEAFSHVPEHKNLEDDEIIDALVRAYLGLK